MTVTPAPGSAALDRPYAADPAAVLTALGSGPDGLTGELAARRFTEVGPNSLPEPEPELGGPSFPSAAGRRADLHPAGGRGAQGGRRRLDRLRGDPGRRPAQRDHRIRPGGPAVERALAGIRNMLPTLAQVRRDGDWVQLPAADLGAGRPGETGCGRQGAGRSAAGRGDQPVRRGVGADRRSGQRDQARSPGGRRRRHRRSAMAFSSTSPAAKRWEW